MTLIGLTIFIGLSCRPIQVAQKANANYLVSKVDSINDYYLVYLIKSDSTYKVVSHKPLISEEKCNKIKLGSSYPFLLRSTLSWTGDLKRLSPKYNPQIGCVAFDDSTSICVEKGMVRDLFSADNLQGLCFIGK